MSTRFFSFLVFVYIASTLICLIVEGSYFGFSATSVTGGSIPGPGTVINDLAAIQQLGIGGLVSVPAAGLTFCRGLVRILLWDYSFYMGGYEILRWFWLGTLSGAAVWGISTVFVPVFANFIKFW